MQKGCPLLIKVIGTKVGNMTPSGCCPHSAEITDEVTSLGGRQVIQEEGDCWGLYLQEKKDRNFGLVRSNKQDASSTMVLRGPGW